MIRSGRCGCKTGTRNLAPAYLPCLRCRVYRLAIVMLLTFAGGARADERDPFLGDLECDPLPFANGGYGCQLGARPPQLHGLRISVAQFSLHVPDVVSQLGGNDGFDLQVRPGSGAAYFLYYFAKPGHDGFTVGGSIRYLRLRYEHDDEPGLHTDVSEISPEAIAGYQWHPFHNGFYLQPWVAFGVVLHRSGKAVVGAHEYDELPISPFFTVNIGWELAL
jgi:hypothetical protein